MKFIPSNKFFSDKGGDQLLFNSYIFLFCFLPLAIIGYYLLSRLFKDVRACRLFLFGMNLWFYAYLDVRFLAVLLGSVLFNYSWAKLLRRLRPGWARRCALAFGLVIQCGALLFFKYTNFFIETFNQLTGGHTPLLSLLLPLGISFFTFQQIALLVDSYRGDAPEYPFVDYLCYATFFPTIMSGPIALHSEILPQLQEEASRRFQWENFSKGLMAFSFGIFKKVLIADTLGRAADYGFASIPGMNSTTAFVVMLCYTLQLYFDFSGYCDMATGLGLFFNIQLPQNFDSPYRALTVADFWKRWHITLTRFFTRYIYIPLGGSRRGTARTCVNVMVIFLISGLWHGANWTFVVWGALHGVAQVACRLFKAAIAKLHPALSWLGTFAFINVTWVIFRAPSLAAAMEFLGNLFRLDLGPLDLYLTEKFDLVELLWLRLRILPTQPRWNLMMCALFLLFALFASVQMKNTNERLRDFKPRLRTLAVSVLLLFWSMLSLSQISSFLYVMF